MFKARQKNNHRQIVAMKIIVVENANEGFPITALREIRILKQLRHKNIVRLLEIVQNKTSEYNERRAIFYLIFEFCEYDLASLLANNNVNFNLGEIKHVMKQILIGLRYIHNKKILHRDMKSANVLIAKTGTLKLANFGLAREISKYGELNNYTSCVVTLWYRSPELLLGERNYGPSVDLWGVGCIMAEMWTRFPIFPGNTEQTQLKLISELCGSITPNVWPRVVDFDLYNVLELPKGLKRKDYLELGIRDPLVGDLLDKLLTLDPDKRINTDSALEHEFFWTKPMPCDLSKILSAINISNYS